MTAIRALLLTMCGLCLSVLGLTAAAAPALADASDDVVRHLQVQMRIDADGRVHVTETYEWDFGTRQGLGLRRELAQQFAWPQDSDLMRIYRYGNISVHSPSGAPAHHWVTGDDAYLTLDIGAPDGSSDTRTGVQVYELNYTIEGALNAIRDDAEVADQDEIYWNVTGGQWDNTIEQVTTTVTGPVPGIDHRCWQGRPNSDEPCTADVQGSTATFTSGTLDPGEEQTIAVAFPPGTFSNIEPILVPRTGEVVGYGPFGSAVAAVTDPIVDGLRSYWPVPAAALLAAYVLGLVRRIRYGRDDHFVDLPPGTFPPAHAVQNHPVAQLEKEPPVVVRFTPPEGLAPAVASRLAAKVGAPQALSATLVDLAVRGFLSLHEAKTDRRGKATDWDLVLSPDATGRRGELLSHELVLLDRIFASGPQVRLTSMRTELPTTSRLVEHAVASQADAQGLFTVPVRAEERRKHKSPRSRSIIWQLVLFLAAGAIGLTATYTDALPASAATLAWIVTGAVGIWWVLRGITASTNFRRSATGRALYEQVRGFKHYLATAEANQIRFTEGIDVFSRYLPYAIVFGVDKRWAAIFEELQAQGRAQVHTGWYVGSHPGSIPDLKSIGSAMSSFTSTVSATSGSSGGSGTGGGGGAGGGGGGGGGGGR